MTMVGRDSGLSGALFLQDRVILSTSISAVVDRGTLFSMGHMRTWMMQQRRTSASSCCWLAPVAMISLIMKVCKFEENFLSHFIEKEMSGKYGREVCAVLKVKRGRSEHKKAEESFKATKCGADP